MNNDSKSISANEINKYLYCPYQWYYERQYGAGYLRAAYKERNERLGLTDTVYSNFRKGLKHHDEYDDKSRQGLGKLAKRLIFIAAVCGALSALYVYYFYLQR